MNLKFLKDNYFSKTQFQEVSVELIITEDAKCKKQVETDILHVFGPIKEAKRYFFLLLELNHMN